MTIINDTATLVYLTETVVCYAAFLLFLWWAIYKYASAKCWPTTVYFLVMLLFLTQAYAAQTALECRMLLSDSLKYNHFITTARWDTRVVPKLIIQVMILWRMARRVYINFVIENKKRKNDKDGEDV